MDDRRVRIVWAAFLFGILTLAKNHYKLNELIYGMDFPSPQYWHVRDSLDYLAWIAGALTIALWVPVSNPVIKYLGICMTASLTIDFIDLQLNGDQVPNYLDSALWFAAVPYSIASYVAYSRTRSAIILPGKVYLIKNKPRELIGLLAAFTIGKGFGSVGVYCNGIYYRPNQESYKWEQSAITEMVLRPGQVAAQVDVTPGELAGWWSEWKGREWVWWRNCFTGVRDLVK